MLQQLVAHFSAVNAKTEMAIERTERDRGSESGRIPLSNHIAQLCVAHPTKNWV